MQPGNKQIRLFFSTNPYRSHVQTCASPVLLAEAGIDLQDIDVLVHANFKGAFLAQLTKKSNGDG
ncbi:MAG TPA: hypothetical protein VM532_16630 [Burkholderiales bacterium]|jgi:hypothetical protein|nr:hypothetical protein [Burkholderiales bacterium]